MKAFVIVGGMLFLLNGCSMSSTIQSTKLSESEFDSSVFSGEVHKIKQPTFGEESYRVFHRGSTGFTTVGMIRESAEKRSTEYCSRSNKSLNVIQERVSVPPHILGNFPKIELIFECLSQH